MSGGHFDYQQYRLNDIAEQINELIADNDNTEKDEYGYEGNHYSDETIQKFKYAVKFLHVASIMVQRIDWLVSGDDGEEEFHERWKEDLKELLEYED